MPRPGRDLIVEHEKSKDRILEVAPSNHLACPLKFLLDKTPAVCQEDGVDATLT
jgi:hypothetical protein